MTDYFASLLSRAAAVGNVRGVAEQVNQHLRLGAVVVNAAIESVTTVAGEVLIDFDKTRQQIHALRSTLQDDEQLLSVSKAKSVTVASLHPVSVNEFAKQLLQKEPVQGWEELAPELYVSVALQLIRAKRQLAAKTLQQLEANREQLVARLRALRDHLRQSHELGFIDGGRVVGELGQLAEYMLVRGTVFGRREQSRQEKLQKTVAKIVTGKGLRVVFRELADAYVEKLAASSVSVVAKRQRSMRQQLARERVSALDSAWRADRRAGFSALVQAIAGLHFAYACSQHLDVGSLDTQLRQRYEEIVEDASAEEMEAAVRELLDRGMLDEADFSVLRYQRGIRQAFLDASWK